MLLSYRAYLKGDNTKAGAAHKRPSIQKCATNRVLVLIRSSRWLTIRALVHVTPLPAVPLKLARFPSRSLLPSQLYLLSR